MDEGWVGEGGVCGPGAVKEGPGALQHGHDYGLVFPLASARATATKDCFVDLDMTRERAATARVGCRHQLAKFMADAPRAFVGHAALTLDFLRGNAVACTRHQVHRKEPHG